LQPGIAGDQGQNVLSAGRADHQANHSRSIKTRNAVGADVGAACLADRFSVELDRDRRCPRSSRLHHHVDLAGREWKDDLARAILELDVLA
jgi:hypothetical protein